MAVLAEELAAFLGGPGLPAEPNPPDNTVGANGLTAAQTAGDGTITKVEDHCADAIGRLLEQFRDKPVIAEILCSYVQPLNDVEAAFCQLLDERHIDVAIGAQLDVIGRLVGEPRQNKTDDAYRVFLRVRLLVLQSDGKREQLLAILRRIFPDTGIAIDVRPLPPAGVAYSVITTTSPIDAAEVGSILDDAKGGGVLLHYVHTNNLQEPATTFVFGAGTSPTASTRGFSSLTSPGGGGKLASVIATG